MTLAVLRNVRRQHRPIRIEDAVLIVVPAQRKTNRLIKILLQK
jgi:hypothetical protein